MPCFKPACTYTDVFEVYNSTGTYTDVLEVYNGSGTYIHVLEVYNGTGTYTDVLEDCTYTRADISVRISILSLNACAFIHTLRLKGSYQASSPETILR